MVVVPSRPVNTALIDMVLRTLSNTMVANPVPGDAFGGASLGPVKVDVKVNVAAWLGTAIASNKSTGNTRMKIDLYRVMTKPSLFFLLSNARTTFVPLCLNPVCAYPILHKMNDLGECSPRILMFVRRASCGLPA
jgi:hypothetical protein